MKRSAILVLVTLFAVACGGPATPTPGVVAAEVAQALTVAASPTAGVPTSTPTPPPPTPTPVDTSTAAHATLRLEDGNIYIGDKHFAMGQGAFVFDPDQRLAASPGRMVLTLEDSPIPLVMAGVSSRGFGTAYMDYANSILDISDLSAKRESQLNIATQYAPEGVEISLIKLNIADYSAIFISSQYVVFPDDTRAVADGGPFVILVFSAKPDVVGAFVVLRNGQEIGRYDSLDKEIRVPLGKTLSSDDVIEWRLMDNEQVVAQGIFGVPMSGAIAGVVEYWISVSGE